MASAAANSDIPIALNIALNFLIPRSVWPYIEQFCFANFNRSNCCSWVSDADLVNYSPLGFANPYLPISKSSRVCPLPEVLKGTINSAGQMDDVRCVFHLRFW